MRKERLMPDNQSMLSAREAAEYLRVHVETIRRLARKGELPRYKIGRQWRIPKDALIEWAAAHPREPSARILVVDDEESFRKTVWHFLEGAGFRAEMAANGAEALDLARRGPPDLVLLDLVMPGMSGVDVLKELHRTDPDVPVVIVTGYPDSALMAEALRCAPVTLLPKPVEKSTLIKTVKRVLNGTKPVTAQ